MQSLTKEALQALRERYKRGMRVELIEMDDEQAPPIGTKGTIQGVDDMGSVLVSWDNGSSLNLLYDIDIFKLIDA